MPATYDTTNLVKLGALQALRRRLSTSPKRFSSTKCVLNSSRISRGVTPLIPAPPIPIWTANPFSCSRSRVTPRPIPTLTYSFINVEYLVDTYTAADNSINISGYNVNVKVSAAANNAITLQSDGLHVDISGKADKVANATNGNIAGLDANGNLTDSGVTIAPDADVSAMITDVFGAAS